MLLCSTVNCINLVIPLWVLPNGVDGQLSSICSSIALVAILSPFLHPQYKISLPCFSLSLFLLFQCLPLNVKPSLVSIGYTYIINFLWPYSQIPTNYAPSPFADENVCFHLPFSKECTLFCLLLQYTHDILKVFHFDWCNVRMILFCLSN